MNVFNADDRIARRGLLGTAARAAFGLSVLEGLSGRFASAQPPAAGGTAG